MHCAPILTPQEISRALEAVDALSAHWQRRAPEPLASFTLGAASYLDATRPPWPYRQMIEKTNPLLMGQFAWLYELLINDLSRIWGPMRIHPQLACPGFHIFGALPGQRISSEGCNLMAQPLASVHVDGPYRAHMALWEDFENVDFLNPLSVTLCLSLPRSGGGLNTWQDIVQKTLFCGHVMIDLRVDRHQLTHFQHTPYQQGWVYVSSGHTVHQIAPAKPMLPDDRRITLQAHAVKCDGIWQIFF